MGVTAALRQYPFEQFTGDLPGELLEMVVTDPISRVRLPDGRPAWLVLDYENCCTVLSDLRFSRLPLGETERPRADGPRVLNMDGPPHASLRRSAARPFAPRRIADWRPKVQRIVDDLVDAMIAGPRPADVVSGLVAPLPLYAVCEVLGVPAADRARFYGWLKGINSIVAYGSDEAAAALADVRLYLGGQVAAKRVEPGDDLLSSWLDGGGAELTDEEIVELAMGVLVGGIEINTTTAGLRALFLYPEQLRKLVEHPETAGAAADEMLRYAAVSPMFRVQVVTEDLELGGVPMREGDCVMAIPWVGNRDPRFFPDPNVFDIDRPQPAPHLTFGFGPHYCMGSALGKMQVELAIQTMVRRLPGLAPAIPIDELPWRHDRINCGILSFPIVWDEKNAEPAG